MSETPCTVSLGSVTSWLSGGTPSRSGQSYWGGPIPWISAATLKKTWIHESDQSLTEAGVRAGSRLAPTGATLVLVRGMALHREVRIGMAIRPVSFNQDVKALVPKSGLLPEFLVYALQARSAQILDLVSSAGSGTGVIDTRLLQGLPLWVPDKRTQRSIVLAIDSVDQSIEALDRLIGKKQSIKLGLMQQLLTGRTRLPSFDAPWESRRVGEMGSVLAGKALNVNGSGESRPYLRTKNVLDGEIDLGDVLQMPMTDAEFARFRVASGDVLLNEGQSLDLVGRCSIYRDELGTHCAMQNQLLRFRANLGTSPEFGSHLFRWCQQNGTFSSIATQTTSVAHLGSRRFANLVLLWPPCREEQAAVADVLSDADAEVAVLRRRLTKARDIKTGMMQQLLTGRTLLPVPETAA